jgi:TLC domain
LTYHLYELLYSILFHRGRADFPEYVLHHLMTWSLIFFSYSLNMLPMGCVVMLVHDVTDLSVTLFKLTIDVTPIYVQAITYGTMLVSWVYFRLWFFPRNIIYRLYAECYSGQYSCPNVNFSMLNMLFAFISGLLCLHVFWFYLMVQGLIRRFRSKNFVNHISISGSVNRDTNSTEKASNQ